MYVLMKVKVKLLSCVRLFATSWTVARQAPPSMGFSRQEYWSGLPLPSPGDLPDPGIEPGSPTLQADALPSKPPGYVLVACPNFRVNACFYIYLTSMFTLSGSYLRNLFFPRGNNILFFSKI